MKRRKFLYSSATALTGTSLLVGTGAFSSVETDRETRIEIVGDENAYMRIDRAAGADEVSDLEEFTLVELENQFASDFDSIDISLTVDEPNVTVDSTDLPDADDLGVGESAPVELALDFPSYFDVGDYVEIELELDGATEGIEEINLTRTYTVQFVPDLKKSDFTVCVAGNPGSGNVFVDGPSRAFPLDITIVFNSTGGGTFDREKTIQTPGGNTGGLGNGNVAGVNTVILHTIAGDFEFTPSDFASNPSMCGGGGKGGGSHGGSKGN